MIQESVKRLLDRVNNEENHTCEFPPSIYMAPSVLRDLSPSCFNPQLVSIGPLHREDENVKAFEGQKISYLIYLMSYINSPQEEILESCMQKAYSVMNEIKGCYIWTKAFSDAEIAEMMVLDACFILGFIIDEHFSFHKKAYMGKELQYRTIMDDLVLLESQIPLFFLDQMFQCTVLKSNSDVSFIELIKPVLKSHMLFKADLKFDNVSFGTNDHFLSLLHQCYMPPANYLIKERMTNIIYSAIDLDRAGVNFKPSKDPTWVMGMEVKQNQFPWFFWSWNRPTLTMPVLSVRDSTELLFRNLIACEQSFPTQSYVSSYASVMDKLVNTQDDVAKLVESKVLVNIMGSNEEAANMINNICKKIIVSDSYYEEEWEKLIKYCNGYWPKHIAKLRSTYFSSPWSIMALVAGIILFVLQALQTIFTIKH
ncbi:hypothetical protein E3N88_31619 [Mikania micrantha]|uniref:Uncharacterized protein n=1 Tax=Mikania micrantha TaxID=192012 RepID=A0A5N6M676_9ASTR|nr:hypothetical protein E3N88_31619 [Mikania micrantha]